MEKIVLIGYAATGKTSVGRILAEKLGWEFFDTDAQTELRARMSVMEIFARYGEEGFRLLETQTLQLLAPRTNCVIACGGGSVLSPQFEDFARGATVVWLQASAENVASRLVAGTRPLADGKSAEELAREMDKREQFYRRYATVTLSTDDCLPHEAAEKLIKTIRPNAMRYG